MSHHYTSGSPPLHSPLDWHRAKLILNSSCNFFLDKFCWIAFKLRLITSYDGAPTVLSVLTNITHLHQCSFPVGGGWPSQQSEATAELKLQVINWRLSVGGFIREQKTTHTQTHRLLCTIRTSRHHVCSFLLELHLLSNYYRHRQTSSYQLFWCSVFAFTALRIC